VIPGLRYDSFKLTPKADELYTVSNATAPSTLRDSEVSPRLGTIWKLAPMANIFAQYAHGFRAPKPSQVNGGVTNLTATNPYTSIGNPNLKPETSKSFELGLRGRSDALHYSFSVFRGKYKDFIASNVLVVENPAPTPDVFQSVNLSRVTISGFEARGEWAFREGWSISAAYAHARGDSQSNGTETPLVTIDPDKLVLGLRYEQPGRYGTAATLTAVDRKKRNPNPANVTPPGYGKMDLAGWYAFSKRTRLNLGINNLFDKKYVEWADVRDLAATSTVVDAYTQPGRNFTVALSHQF
jgi:hemoglobin/transferrin/lactoferrin receptor protein